MRFFNYVTLLVAMAISACAAYYSIYGMTAIFAAAFWPIVIMGTALELGKLTGAVWLHLNWKKAQWWIKLYMVPAVAVLMLITSMGIFGFLSRAHIEQTAGVVDVTTKVEQLNLDISVEQSKIDNNKKIISQLDAAVDGLLSGSATQGGGKATANAKQASKLAAEATKLRKSQEAQRAQLQAAIQEAADKVAAINKDKLSLEQQAKKIEAEVGPIRYVAALFYGDNPDANTLERAVRWMIIIIVVVFDPLAVVLILAATSGLGHRYDDPIVVPKRKEDPIEVEDEPEEDLKKNLAKNQKPSSQELELESLESPKKLSSTKPRSRKSQ